MRLSLSAGLIVVLLAGCGDNLTAASRSDTTAEPPVLDCQLNLDGRIDSAEMVARFGVPMSFLISPPDVTRDVDLQGRVDSEGRRVWDLGDDYADDEVLSVEAAEATGAWWREEMPSAEFQLPLDAAGATVGVYRQDDEALWLLGSASTESDPPEGRTLLVYEPPVPVFRFPIEPGRSWTASATIEQGVLWGLPFAGTHTYEVSVVESGRLVLPQLTFEQAMQVHTRLMVEPVVGSTWSVRQTRYLFECFGEVARFESALNEPEQAFTSAVEARRLGLGL